MRWYIADAGYIAALQGIDSKVHNIYTGSSIKPYIGVVLAVSGYKYYVPVSSPKPKHSVMKEDIDFIKIHDRKGKLLCVLNLNNMIPIPDQYIQELQYAAIDTVSSFPSTTERDAYVNLLRDELHQIRKKKAQIEASATELRKRCLADPQCNLAMRSCDFARLEAHVSTPAA